MSHTAALCQTWMPSEWEVCPRTELSGEGWISGRPRKARMRNLLPTPLPLWQRHLDEDVLLSRRPHLAIALLRRNLVMRAS